ncbi:hypothetical protein AGMMS49928_22050 [Spirochaetia bacterium]|nr:hypothetical protein AGMMS49928_22050 [Spirochaetia bacterium]
MKRYVFFLFFALSLVFSVSAGGKKETRPVAPPPPPVEDEYYDGGYSSDGYSSDGYSDEEDGGEDLADDSYGDYDDYDDYEDWDDYDDYDYAEEDAGTDDLAADNREMPAAAPVTPPPAPAPVVAPAPTPPVPVPAAAPVTPPPAPAPAPVATSPQSSTSITVPGASSPVTITTSGSGGAGKSLTVTIPMQVPRTDTPPAPAETAAAQPAPVPAVKLRTWPATVTVPTARDGAARNTGPASIRSLHYEVTSDVGEYDGLSLAGELEGRFEVYNRLFRFNPASLQAGLLKVRAFSNRKDYDAYVTERLGYTRPGVVYLHFREPEKRELIVHRGGEDTPQLLPHQAFIQFFRAFVSNPPLWMREGFALYFNSLRLTDSGDGGPDVLTFAENLSWLGTIREMGDDTPAIAAMLQMDTEGPLQRGELLSWSLVSFFLNSGSEEYFRTLTESFIVLSPDASAKANGEAVMKHISLWTDAKALEKDYRAYVASRRTFTDLVAEGRKAYDSGDKVKAELSFMSALNQNRDHYAPYYYLGLLAYDAKDYDRADLLYLSALKCGADPALTAYARGLNAYSAGRSREARAFLEEAAVNAPERYRERANQLNARLR